MGHHSREMEVEAVEAQKGVEVEVEQELEEEVLDLVVEEVVSREVEVDSLGAQLRSGCRLFHMNTHRMPTSISSMEYLPQP